VDEVSSIIEAIAVDVLNSTVGSAPGGGALSWMHIRSGAGATVKFATSSSLQQRCRLNSSG
jgi:hypothetical protein